MRRAKAASRHCDGGSRAVRIQRWGRRETGVHARNRGCCLAAVHADPGRRSSIDRFLLRGGQPASTAMSENNARSLASEKLACKSWKLEAGCVGSPAWR